MTRSSCAARSAAGSRGGRRTAGRCCSSRAARASCRWRRWCASARASGSDVPAQLILSARTEADVFYRAELERLAEADPALDLVLTLTRERNPAWTGRRGRVDRALLEEVAFAAAERPHAFVCGPTAFVEAVADGLVALGHAPERVRTERFGPSGT